MPEILVPIDDIDEAIKQNRYKYRPGMEKPDLEIMNRIGKRKWKQAEDAQRRLKEEE